MAHQNTAGELRSIAGQNGDKPGSVIGEWGANVHCAAREIRMNVSGEPTEEVHRF